MKDPEKFAGIAFISFQTEDMKELVLQHNQATYFERIRIFFADGKLNNPKGDELMMKGNKLFCE